MTRVTTISPAKAPQAELTRKRRIGILLICSMSLLIVGLDSTIVNIALPSIGHDMHAGVSGLQWVIDAYSVVLASLLMLSGSTADRFGRRRTFMSGLTIFCIASLLCSIAPSIGLLVAFRMLQAIGGSMLNPVAMSIITNTFTDLRERAQAVGVLGAVAGISLALGPIVGGLLVASAGWRSIFWVNLPIGLTAIILAVRFVPESRAPHPRRFDPVGQILIIVLFGALTFAIIEAPSKGWTSAIILASLIAAVVALAGVLIYEPRRRDPLIDLRFFRSIPFSAAALTAIVAFSALGGFLFLNTLYLQDVRGLSPLHAGLATLPMATMAIGGSLVSGRLVGTRGPRPSLLLAPIGLTTGSAMLAFIEPTTPFTWLFVAYVIFGIGYGLVNAPITNTAVSGMPRTQACVAAAVASTSRSLGSTLGVAVVGAMVASQLHTGVGPGFAAATHSAWWLLAGCGVAVFVLGLIATSKRGRDSAHRVAVELNPEVVGSLPVAS